MNGSKIVGADEAPLALRIGKNLEKPNIRLCGFHDKSVSAAQEANLPDSIVRGYRQCSRKYSAPNARTKAANGNGNRRMLNAGCVQSAVVRKRKTVGNSATIES